MGSLQRNRLDWERNASSDPLWSILTDREKKNRIWDEDEFFKTGELEITRVFEYMDKHGISVGKRGSFLDFGCGVGRVSRALARRFSSGYGVDVSSTMVKLAENYNAN